MTARKTASKERTRDDAISVVMDACAKLPTSAAIADALSVNGKTVRGRVRAGTLRTHDDAPLPGVRVSKDGQSALTDAHKRAIAYTFAPQDDAQVFALADKLAPQDA